MRRAAARRYAQMPTAPALSTAPLRIAVIGCGLIAQAIHLPRLRRMADRFALVAFADRSATVREQLAARYRPARAYADWRVLLERERLDALVVCSPHATHAEIVLAALDLGVKVLVEKPLCVTLDDAAEIVRRERETGLVVQVGYMKRHHPAYAALLAELPADTDERLRLVDVVTYDPWMARAPYVEWDDLVFGSDVPTQVRDRDERRRWEQLATATSSDAERPRASSSTPTSPAWCMTSTSFTACSTTSAQRGVPSRSPQAIVATDMRATYC